MGGRHGDIKVIVKDTLRLLPIFGWVLHALNNSANFLKGMMFLEFIFLKRKWSLDKLNYTRILTRAMNDNLPLWLIIFPEGTVICEETRIRSDAYAKKMDWGENPRHVLWPKHTGLFHACDLLKDNVDNIFDLTMAFSGIDDKTFA